MLTELELKFIRQLVGQQPHDQVNALCVKLERMLQALEKPDDDK